MVLKAQTKGGTEGNEENGDVASACGPRLARSANATGSSPQFRLPQTLDELNEPRRLFAQAVEQFGIVEAAGGVEEIVDLRQEDAFGIDMGIAIAEDRLELFDGPQR